MKVFNAPSTVRTPVVDYKNYDHEVELKKEADYLVCLKAHLETMGYTGPLTGVEFNIPWADGAARYMVADGNGKQCLIHLPLGDAWSVPVHLTRGIRKSDIVRQQEMNKRFARL